MVMLVDQGQSGQVYYDNATGRYYTQNVPFGMASFATGSRSYLDGSPFSGLNNNTITPQGYSDVTDLYRRTLGRDPSEQELNAWNNKFGIASAPKINTIADLYQHYLHLGPEDTNTVYGQEYWGKQWGDNPIGQEQINQFLDAAKRGKFTIYDPTANNPSQLTSEQIDMFQQAAKPELKALSEQKGYRPSSSMDQWYQPVYETQYTNYANPGYSLFGQPNYEQSYGITSLLNKAMSMPYAGYNPQTGANQLPKIPTTIPGLYQTYLGRAPEQAGLDYWAQRFGDTVDPTEARQFLEGAKAWGQSNDLNTYGQQFGQNAYNTYRNLQNNNFYLDNPSYFNEGASYPNPTTYSTGLPSLMSGYSSFGSPYSSQGIMPSQQVKIQGRDARTTALSPKFGRPSTGQSNMPASAYTAMTGLKR